MLLLNSSAPRGLTITEATLPLTYSAGLEYSAPARGTWTIMHLGLLIPETHIIFVCARCCLRGVSMSAAELRALDRFSTITIEDRNLLEGDTEKALIDGVTDILSHLAKRPRGVIIYTSCVHEFIGSDLTFSFETLRERFPDIRFTDGYMTPILRKRITPDKRNRRQIYTLLQTSDDRDNGVTVVGDVRPMTEHSDFRALVEAAGLPWRSITATRTWADYQALGESRFAVTFNPTADAAIDWMAEHLGQKVRQFSAPWLPEAIEKEKTDLARFLGIALTDESERRNEALAALENARTTIGQPRLRWITPPPHGRCRWRASWCVTVLTSSAFISTGFCLKKPKTLKPSKLKPRRSNSSPRSLRGWYVLDRKSNKRFLPSGKKRLGTNIPITL